MATRVTDLDSGRSWDLLAHRANYRGELDAQPWFSFRVNCKSSADVSIGRPWISKHHGSIEYRNRRWWANDGGSVNTVTVNGERITHLGHAITNGDVLGLGQTRLLFETDGGPPDPPPR
jgi:pSer/pThr/pTyr-binding forkhead associated (FHA) protein